AKGKTLKEALGISDQEISDALGGLSDDKMHCSHLAADALKSAIHDYLNKKMN
ncbi:MAG: iron-sulfur cluster assembly scaffold protein, partial [Promethearchaeia archaeon]